MLAAILLSLLFQVGTSLGADPPPQANTTLGVATGSWAVSRGGRKFAAFRKLPFAKPPVGQLRFQAPEPAEPWDGVNNASVPLPLCAQVVPLSSSWEPIGQEDCLYLSVFTHNVTGSAPVLFYIHGGAFAFGTSAGAGPEYLMDEDLVIVRVSYRVGILGFFSFEDARVPGNQGMKDQVMGLQWVQKNIASFGGDPKQVTIIGESAGGASVYHHLVSPLSKGLFHRAISESGTSYAIWAVAPPGFARSKAEHLLDLLNCTTDVEKGLPCALNKSATEVVSKFKEFMLWGSDPMHTFGPVLEKKGPNAFLVGPIKGWKSKPVPLLMGMTSAEGLLRTLSYLSPQFDINSFNADFKRIAPLTYSYFSTASDPNAVTKEIRRFYFGNRNITMNDWVNLTTVYSDIWFTNSVLDGANNHTGDVYFYYFDYILKELTPGIDEKLIFGAIHVAESAFIWKRIDSFTPTEVIKRVEEETLSKKLVKIVTNFVKHGTPNIDGSPYKWEKWTKDNNIYTHINKTGFYQKRGLAEDRYRFWQSVSYRDNYDVDEPGSPGAASRTITAGLFLIMIISLLHYCN